jgi:2-C-methyl-D-erythritol 4-phosphate cytidylyltransferase
MKYYALIVAGGSGNRMQSAVAKQFLPLEGKPVLMHTLTAFYNCSLKPTLLLVLNIHQHTYWEELCAQYDFQIPHEVVKGGVQRFHSVKNGLKAIKGNGIVAIHDAVRPLVSTALITRSFEVAVEKGNCIPGVTPTDSIRKILPGDKSEALTRSELALVQTPQTFSIDLLRKAYKEPFRNDFTDDASVVQYSGVDIHLIEGERENLKLTYPEDMEIAALFLKKRSV